MSLPPSFPHRSVRTEAFTLVELLITIAIIAILAALCIPVLSATLLARDRTVCLQNMKQIGGGILTFCNDNGGSFPPFASPEGRPWNEQISTYLGLGENQPSRIFKCPADTRQYNLGGGSYARSYSMSGTPNFDDANGTYKVMGIVETAATNRSRKLLQVTAPANTILLSEWWSSAAGQIRPNLQNSVAFSAINGGWLGYNVVPILPDGRFAHGKTINFLFVDGHSETLVPDEIWKRRPTVGYSFWTVPR